MSDYDSRQDTLDHIFRVRDLMEVIINELAMRALEHDRSKLQEPEKSLFDRCTPLLRSLEYGSPEYMSALDDLGPALEHHYQNNRHHPEYFAAGTISMNLIDIIEMLADWKAASERVPDGSLKKSLPINIERFSIAPPLGAILYNTAHHLGWIDDDIP